MAAMSGGEVHALAQRHWGDAKITGPFRPGGAQATIQVADLMTAIAYKESGWDPRAHRPPDARDDSYGLWQINMLGALGPDRRRRSGLASNTDLFDPETNARVAKQNSDEAGFAGPWKGSYLPAAQAVAKADDEGGGWVRLPGILGGGTLGGGVTEPVAGAINSVADTLTGGVLAGVRGLVAAAKVVLDVLTDPEWWRRIGIGLLGVALFVAAVVIANRGLFATAAGGALAGPAGAAAGASLSKG